MLVEVTYNDMYTGVCRSCFDDPLAHAIRRAVGATSVHVHYAQITIDGKQYITTPALTAHLTAYDKAGGLGFGPYTVEICDDNSVIALRVVYPFSNKIKGACKEGIDEGESISD